MREPMRDMTSMPCAASWARTLGAALVCVGATSCTGTVPSPDSGEPTAEPRAVELVEPVCVAAEDIAVSPDLAARLAEHGIWSLPWSDPPSESALLRGLPEVPPGVAEQSLVWKNALVVREGAAGAVSVVDPGDATLVVTTWDEWEAGLTAEIVRRREARTVHVRSCDDSSGSYPGMIVMDAPACVELSIEIDGEPERRIEAPYFGAECPDSTDLG